MASLPAYAERLQPAVHPILAHFGRQVAFVFLLLGWVHGQIEVATATAAAIWWDQRVG